MNQHLLTTDDLLALAECKQIGALKEWLDDNHIPYRLFSLYLLLF